MWKGELIFLPPPFTCADNSSVEAACLAGGEFEGGRNGSSV